MKTLRPRVIVILGAALTAALFAVVCVVWEPGKLQVSGVLIGLVCGGALGLVTFGTIAAGLLLGERMTERLAKFARAADRYASLVMAISLGYAIASVRHHNFDGLTAVAYACLFLGAGAKVALAMASERPDRTDVESDPPPKTKRAGE
jgi:hypothetical protein